MRILQLRFKNLNSLLGEWEIDLTHPSFASDGIFAITGPTGAGKTTILDAVCLALYGRTPRLDRVNKGGNEIMSRQSGECYAEVTFETQSGRYRSHWSQHRARKRPDGELQAPRHEIADADSGRIFEARIRGVAEQIEAATGMDFDRFTRSMLLAQGGFAAFLQAAPDERAPILEQITGTDIYSRISIRVHERRSEERKRLDTLSAERDAMPLLSEEDERRLATGLEQNIRQEAELSRQITRKTQAVTWLDGIAGLERELQRVAEQKRDWQARQEAFAPERERLQQATRAMELAGEHAALTSLRGAQETDRSRHRECAEKRPAHEEAVRRAEEVMKRVGSQLDARKAEQKEAVPVMRKVRELDLKIREKHAPIKTADDAVSELEKSLHALRLKQDEDVAALNHKKNFLAELVQAVTETRADEALVEHLAGIRGQFDALKNLHARQSAKIEEVKTADGRMTEATRIWHEQSENLETRKRGLESSKGAFTQRQFKLKNLLEDRDLPEWRNRLSALTERTSLLDKAIAAVQSLAESRRSLGELDRRHEALMGEKATLDEQLQARGERHDFLEREMNLLETQRSLLKKIRDFEEARRQLQDGEPCPLCGAEDHPFAAGNIPVPDETTSALGKVRADLKTARDAVAELKVKQAEVNKDLEQATSGQKASCEKITASEALIRQHCAALSLDAADPDLDEGLQRQHKENAEMLGSTTRIVQAAETMEKEIAGLRESLEKTKESVAQLERETQSAAHEKDTAGQQLERLKQEAEALEAEQKKALSRLRQELSAYGIETLSLDVLDPLQAQLTAQRDQWVERQKEKSELERQIAALAAQTGHRAEQLQKSASELKKKRDLLGDLQREQDALSQERRALFGDENPDDVEHRLSAAIEAAEKEQDAARRSLDAATQERGKLKNSIEALEKTMAARAGQLRTAEGAFTARLDGLDFADEERFRAACLPEDERNTLMRQAQALAEENTALTARERDKTALLASERQKRLTEQARDEIDRILAGLVAAQKGLQQEIGGIRQRLTDNENLKQRQRERAQAIDAQRREYARWDLLHELIGSADGKKYRNFAQGLTFEMMIGHANRQLQKMTERYLLIRDDARPLELNVIDNYQAGEIRSTKNLSGGESFIVSLSLALGLSHMASKNVRVDSLFLDEGFGTLDEEALDTALETLAGLQQDGKLIGVISHVPALKERIGTQIQVTPQTGGRSAISGPGCGRSGATMAGA